jgi:ATP/ADP translocase
MHSQMHYANVSYVIVHNLHPKPSCMLCCTLNPKPFFSLVSTWTLRMFISVNELWLGTQNLIHDFRHILQTPKPDKNYFKVPSHFKKIDWVYIKIFGFLSTNRAMMFEHVGRFLPILNCISTCVNLSNHISKFWLKNLDEKGMENNL